MILFSLQYTDKEKSRCDCCFKCYYYNDNINFCRFDNFEPCKENLSCENCKPCLEFKSKNIFKRLYNKIVKK